MTTPRSRTVRGWRAAVFSLLMGTGVLFAFAATSSPAVGQTSLLSEEEQALLAYVNDYRVQNGLNTLSVSASLTEAARWMSRDMGDGNYFGHTDSFGRSPFDRMAAAGYDCVAHNTWCGENLAAGISTGSETFELWRNSPGHNGNMLNPNYVVAGIAAVLNQDSTYGWYWTLDMGGFDDNGQAPPTVTPEATPTEPTPTPAPPPPTETPSQSPTATPTPPGSTTPSPSPTATLEPSPTLLLSAPTEAAPPSNETVALPVDTPTEVPSPTAISTPAGEIPSPTEEVPASTAQTPAATEPPAEGTARQFGQAPPTRGNDIQAAETRVVRQLNIGWNLLEVTGQARKVTEALPVADGDLLAVYSWDPTSRSWRRYLPQVGVLGVNTLTEVGANQTVWVLAVRRVVVTLSA